MGNEGGWGSCQLKGHFTVFVLLRTGHLGTCFFHRNYSCVYFKSLNA